MTLRNLDSAAGVDNACGLGGDVAAFRASRPPNCPVLIHSSNALRARAGHLRNSWYACTASWSQRSFSGCPLCPATR